MPIKSKRIHLIERYDRIIKVDDQIWECGGLLIPEPLAKKLLEGSLFFHNKRSEPSYFGGIILNYRLEDKGKLKGMVVFTFEYRADHRYVSTEGIGWSKGRKVVGVKG